MSGYGYTTITMKPDTSPRVSLYITPDEHARVFYHPSKEDPHAFVSVEYAGTQMSIGLTANTRVTDVHVRFARELLTAAAAFLADCERLRDEHAKQATPDKAA
ncbi:hypothetical protein AB0O34_20320 [Sphaerisporangium sp. NPDC088356]|uniref:hypothetical protein n=1 Tax=Sphaerisporangium sp. NPDC088356 TaxID=3154871 RepID=UPI003412D0C5